jgi:sulfate/thiosulfate transport system ATP-binding protein
MPLEIKSLSKAFGQYPALNDVSLTAADGEFLALLGPSGSGKTTLLRILAGLEQPDAGEVLLNGEDFLSQSIGARRVGMVFQHYALFRHMTVEQNIAFGLKVRPAAARPKRKVIAERVTELLALMQLEGLGRRFPSQLSGGQRQRVALARALAIEPRMLLLDEPFGALDAQVRRELRRWLRQVHDRTGVTTVFVTHDQEEALDLADRVAVLKDGSVVQVGEPHQVYAEPVNGFVYDFLGPACRLPGLVADGQLRVADWVGVAPPGAPDGAVELYFRPSEVSLAPADGPGFSAKVLHAGVRGASGKIECAVGDVVLELEAVGSPRPAFLSRGADIRVTPDRYKLYPAPIEK